MNNGDTKKWVWSKWDIEQEEERETTPCMRIMNLEKYPSDIVLRNGDRVIFRPMVREDRENIILFFMALCEREKLFIRDDDINPALAVPWPGYLDYSRSFPILALYNNKIIGIATLHRSDFSWLTHLGNIRITVSPDHRRKGLGRTLAGELFRNSLQLGLDKIVTEIVKDQVEVSLFYNCLGFRTEASLTGHFLDDDGVKHDILIMSNNLKQLWKYWVEESEKMINIKHEMQRQTGGRFTEQR
jgi:GNAT superfamily N-acetyltransferase